VPALAEMRNNMSGGLNALPQLPVTSPLRARRKCRERSGEGAGHLSLPATVHAGVSPHKGDDVHAILEGLTQTAEEMQHVKKEAQELEQNMTILALGVERMLEERDVDGAFELLRRNLWKATQKHRDNRAGNAATYAEAVFQLALQHSATDRWKFEFTQQRIIPFLCNALSPSDDGHTSNPLTRTCALYVLANLTSEDLCIDSLMVEGVLRVFFDVALKRLEFVDNNVDDNQRQETLWLASFCRLANNRNPIRGAQRCHNLGVVATLALLNVAHVSMTWAEQVDRFRFVDEGGLELLLRFAGHPKMEEELPSVVERVMTMLRAYSHSDLIRFKRRGTWRGGDSPDAKKVLYDLLVRAASLRDEENAREELGRAARALVDNDGDPSVLVDRLDTVKMVVEIELEGGYQTVQLPVSPRTTLTPSLTGKQIDYVAWTERIRALARCGKHTGSTHGANAFLAKARLEHTQATAECDKVHATIIQIGHRPDRKDVYTRDLFRLRDSTARVLAVAALKLHLAEALHATVSAGYTIENMSSSTDIHHLEHAELVAQRVFALEAQKKKNVSVDIETLLAPVRTRKADLVAQLERKTRALRHDRAHLERQQRAKRGRRGSSELNNAAAAAAATAAAASTAASASAGEQQLATAAGGGANAAAADPSRTKARQRRRRHRGSGAVQNSASAAAAAATAVAAAAIVPGLMGESVGGKGRRQRARRGRGGGQPQETEADKALRSALHELTHKVRESEGNLYTAQTTKITGMFNREEDIAYTFLQHALRLASANVEAAESALRVAATRLATERILLAMKVSEKDAEESLRLWARFEFALRDEHAATVQMAVSAQALQLLQEKIERERKSIQQKIVHKSKQTGRCADGASPDTGLDRESEKHYSNLAAARMLLASMVSDLAMLRFIDSVISSRLPFLHPRALHLREEYQNKEVRPCIVLAILNTKAARAQVTLFEAGGQHGQIISSPSTLEGLKRGVSFACWCVANNAMHKQTHLRVAHDPMRDIMHDNHASTKHVMHIMGEHAVHILVASKSEEIEAEVAFAKANEATLHTEQAEGICDKDAVLCATLSMYGGAGSDDYAEHLGLLHHGRGQAQAGKRTLPLPHPHGELNLGAGLFLAGPGTDSSWRACQKCRDMAFPANVRVRVSHIMGKIQDLVKSASNCVALLREQFDKVVAMVHKVRESQQTTLPPSMRIALEREKTIFTATKKKLHHANFILAQNYSMITSTLEVAYAEAALSEAKGVLSEQQKHEAREALDDAENFLIVATKTLGSHASDLTDAEMRAMRAEMEKLRGKRTVEQRKKKREAEEARRRKVKEDEAERMAKFQQAKREKRKEEKRRHLVQKEAEVQRIKKIKKEKSERERKAYAERKAVLAKEKAHLVHLQQEWRLENIQAKRDLKESKKELRRDAEACTKYVLKNIIIMEHLGGLIDESEANAREKRKADVIYGKKMIKESKNWEETEEGGWLNWRSGKEQRTPPDCILKMWEMGRMWPSEWWVQQGYGNGPGGWAVTEEVAQVEGHDWGGAEAAEEEEERRYAADGGYYTANEFYEFFGGWDEWYAAEDTAAAGGDY
jgi:hypothetical protein